MKKANSIYFVISLCLIIGISLISCGGGGGGNGGDVSVPNEVASGIWEGTFYSQVFNETYSVTGIIAETNEMRFITSSGGQYVGIVSVNGNSVSCTATGYAPIGTTFPDGSLIGTVKLNGIISTKEFFSGTYSGVGDEGTFSVTYNSIYEVPSSLSSVSGSWVYTESEYTLSFTIDSNGAISGSDTNGCEYTGIISIIDTQYNVYRVTLNAASCGILNGNYNGLVTLLDSSTMILGASNPNVSVTLTLSFRDIIGDTKIQLQPLQYIAQTNSSIDFRAKVLDGNGNPVKNEPVTFTNLSPIGVINPQLVAAAGGVSIATSGPLVVNTDSLGFATITLFSTTSGFATVQAEVNTGLGQVRDSRTILFITGSLSQLPDLILDVDGDGDGIFNEPSDFIFFETTTDDIVQVRATVFDRFGLLEPFSLVTFGADVPYRIGPDPEATCSDGSDVCEVFFMFGNTAFTNSSGQGSVFVQVTDPALRNVQTLFNVTAVADNGAADLVTLFVQPVTVALVTVSANPVTVECGGTSTITAFVTTSAGTRVPDGTSVSFTVDIGSIEPFAQTTDGIAEVEYTAPDCDPGDPDQVATITATVAGVFGTTTVTVTAEPLTPVALSVQPPAQTISGVTGGIATFTILNGTPGYSIFSSDLLFPPVPPTVAASGGTFTVTVAASTPATTVTYTIIDAAGDSVTATLTISGPGALTVTPSTTLNLACGGNVLNYTITGGIPPYTVVSGNPLITIGGGPFTTDPATFTATTAACASFPPAPSSTPVTITVDDSDAPSSQVIVILTITNP